MKIEKATILVDKNRIPRGVLLGGRKIENVATARVVFDHDRPLVLCLEIYVDEVQTTPAEEI
ncbi:MAG: hypothetical protein ACM32F_08480 [Betaproteobacteria bacterium]